MGEYAKFAGREVKIGTCESMYYLRADQRHLVQWLPGNVDPVKDATDIRFRFPWPDEDHVEPGGFKDYNRAVTVAVPMPEGVEHGNVQFVAQAGYNVCLPCPEGPDQGHGLKVHRNGFAGAVRLVQQKAKADGRIVPVCQCGGCGALWRFDEPHEIEALAVAFRAEADRRERQGQHNGTGKADRRFYDLIADRILAGAKLSAVAV